MKIDRGIVAAIGAAVLFGLSTPLAKLLAGSLSPLLLAGLLYLGSGLGLATLLIVRATLHGRAALSVPRGPDAWWLLGAIVCGGVIGPYLLVYGLQFTDAASASLILNLEGCFTALLAWFVFKENFDGRIALGMTLIIGGGAVLSLGSTWRAGNMLGPLAIAAACLAWAVDNNLTRRIAVHDAMFIAGAKGLVAGTTSVSLALAFGARLPALATILQAALIGFVGFGLSLTLFVVALRHLGAARTGAYFSLAPFIGATLALTLGAPLTPLLIMAALLMGAGLWLHLTEQHVHWHRHVRLEHEHSHLHDEHHQHSHDPEWDGKQPHSHRHVHQQLEHSHAHYPEIHHRHSH